MQERLGRHLLFNMWLCAVHEVLGVGVGVVVVGLLALFYVACLLSGCRCNTPRCTEQAVRGPGATKMVTKPVNVVMVSYVFGEVSVLGGLLAAWLLG